jgi:hypothetical protein
VDYATTQPGTHRWRLTTTGPTTAVADIFDVRESSPPLIVSLGDAKRQLNIPADRTDDDEELRGYIEAATLVIETDPDWGVGPVVPRIYVDRVRKCETRALVLRHRPVLSITSVASTVVGGTDYDAAALDVDKEAGVVRRKAGVDAWFVGGPWDVTYTAGLRVVPANISHAARIIIQHLWSTQRSRDVRRPPVAMAGDLVETRTSSGVTFSIPRKAVELLGGASQAGGFA